MFTLITMLGGMVEFSTQTAWGGHIVPIADHVCNTDTGMFQRYSEN